MRHLMRGWLTHVALAAAGIGDDQPLAVLSLRADKGGEARAKTERLAPISAAAARATTRARSPRSC